MVTRKAHQIVFITFLFTASCLFDAADAMAEMEDDPLLVLPLIDQFELRDVGGDNTLSWDTQGWIGKDLRKLWIKFEGDRSTSGTDSSELQFLYSMSIARYWEFQVGVRNDFKPSPSRTWAAVGVQGLAPYFFETDIAFFVGDSGRTALRLETEYELLFTQRLILTPDIEVNFFGKDDPDILIGSGLSEIEIGLRLRYEIRREFAPYIGVNWSKLFGNTAEFTRTAGQDTSEAQLVIGLRAWF
jgi:copper resistance protein B